MAKLRPTVTVLMAACVLAISGMPAAAAGPDGPLAPNDNSPHNMGYCARFLGGGGLGVRPDVNRLLASSSEMFGYRNPGDLYSDRARSTTDRSCLAR